MWMGSKDSNLERGLQRRSSYQLLHFPTRLKMCSRTVFLAGEVRFELTRERCQKRVYKAKTWLRQDFGINGSGLPIGPLPNVVERPGIEPGFSVLQTDARTIYAISRWLRQSFLPHSMVAASRVELEGRGYEPRCVTRHTPHQRTPLCMMSREYVLDGVLEKNVG
jgi:hypothetical protein